MTVIGITGTLGAGKGTIVAYLVSRHGYTHYSVRSLLTSEIVARGLEVNRDTMVAVANDLRRANSPSVLIERLYREAEQGGRDAVIESIRTVGEIEALRGKADFMLFAVDAPARLRFERILARGSRTDSVSYEEFVEHERREMSSGDPNQQNLSACMSLADYTFCNDSDPESLYQQVEDALAEIGE